MAGAGRRIFQPGEVLTASNTMNYLMDQTVMNFAGTAARGSAIGTAVSEGMVSYLADTDSIEVYTNAWMQVYPSVANVGEIVQVVSTAIDVDAVRKIDVVDFRYKSAVKEHGDDAVLEVGVIAEQLLELGLDQFVFFDDAGQPAGVHYEMLSVAVLKLVQAQADRLDSLEARVAKLEK